jgi:oligopeptide transport system substrate-binding protein
VATIAAPVPSATPAPRIPKGTLRYPLSADPQTLDPQLATDDSARLVVEQLYEGLFTLQPAADGRSPEVAVPAAASGYQASSDGTVYTITLRPGTQWSDGEPVTAQHFVDGICRALSPALGNSLDQQTARTARISGAAAYASGATGDCSQIGVKALDPGHLRFTLDEPNYDLPELLALQAFLPARLDVADEGRKIASTNNGPYSLVEWQPGERVVLARNAHYWNASSVGIERIEFQIVEESAGQLKLYEEGALHVAEFPLTDTQHILAQATLRGELHAILRPGTSYLALNTQAGPTADINFRRAVASAIDRQALANEALQQPWHRAAQTIIPPGVAGYSGSDAGAGYAYSLAAARDFLAQAGYNADNPPPPLEIWTNREGNNPTLVEAIAAMLEKAGIPTRLVSSNWDNYLASLDACNKPAQPAAARTPAECSYNAYRLGWIMDSPDPASLLGQVFSPESTLQYSGWQSAKFQELLANAAREPDPAKRGDAYHAAEKLLLNDDVVVVPLLYYDRPLLVKKGVAFQYPLFSPPNFQFWQLP